MRDVKGDAWLLNGLLDRVSELERKVAALEKQTPEARQLQYEADVAAADLAASGYADDPPIGADRPGPGCLCPYCPDEDDLTTATIPKRQGDG